VSVCRPYVLLKQMKTETVCVKLNRKANLGNYESIDCEVFVSAKADDDESPADVAEYLGFQAKEAISRILEKETFSPPFVNVTKTTK
jgi:hypothetical protein